MSLKTDTLDQSIANPELAEIVPIRSDIGVLHILQSDAIKSHNYIVIKNNGKCKRKNSLKLNWTIKEVIGIGVINTRGISK